MRRLTVFHSASSITCLFALVLLTACGGGGSSSNVQTLSITASANTVLLGNTLQFSSNVPVTTWIVGNTVGGDSTEGTISSTGLYTAPITLPTVTAISVGATNGPSQAGGTIITVKSDVSVSLSTSPGTNILTGSTVTLAATVTSAGAPSKAITWTVNGIVNGNSQVGTIAAGLNGAAVYTAPIAAPATAVTITATSVADPLKSASASTTVLTALAVSSSSSTVLLGKTAQFSANDSVAVWSVNGVTGGNTTTGTITSTGLYTAPAVLPANTAIAVTAVGSKSSIQTASATITVNSDVAVSLTPSATANPILTSSSLGLTAAVNSAGNPNTGVVWTVAGIANGNSAVGTISLGAGNTVTYTAPAIQPTSSIQIIATSVADPSKSAAVTRTVQGILLSASSGIPGSVVTVSGNFNTSTAIQFTFSDGKSYNPTISVTPSSASQATLIVPLYPGISGFGQGLVSVSASQSAPIGSAPGFVIEALPVAAGSLGAVTTAALKQTYAGYRELQNEWQLVGTASGGKVATANVTGTTADIQTHILSLLGSVMQVASGGAGFSVGTTNGSTMQINASSLALMDAIFQAFIINSPAVQSAISSLPPATLARLRVPIGARTAEENLRAYSALSPKSALSPYGNLVGIAGTLAVLAAVVIDLPVASIALTAAVAIGVVMMVEGVLTPTLQAVGQVLQDALNALATIQNAEADDTTIQSALSNSGTTLSGDEAALLSDSQALNGLLDPNNANSPGQQANNNQPGIGNNAPVPPPSTSAPTLTATGYTIPLTGQILVNTFLQNAPPGSNYTLTSTWGDSATITSDQYGYGFQALVTPVPPSGGCYQGTVTLTNAYGANVASTSGCFGANEIDVYLSVLAGSPTGSGVCFQDVSINGYSIGSVLCTSSSLQGNFKLPNVVAGTSFTITVTPGPIVSTYYPPGSSYELLLWNVAQGPGLVMLYPPVSGISGTFTAQCGNTCLVGTYVSSLGTPNFVAVSVPGLTH